MSTGNPTFPSPSLEKKEKSAEELRVEFEKAMKTLNDLRDQFVWRQIAIDKSQYQNVSWGEIKHAQELATIIQAELRKIENKEKAA